MKLEHVYVALAMLLIVGMVMAALHEQHYRARRAVILEARPRGIEARIEAIERLLAEDRLV